MVYTKRLLMGLFGFRHSLNLANNKMTAEIGKKKSDGFRSHCRHSFNGKVDGTSAAGNRCKFLFSLST